MANQAPEEHKDSQKASQTESDAAKRRPDADEPVTHEEHSEEALEKASERMLRREPED